MGKKIGGRQKWKRDGWLHPAFLNVRPRSWRYSAHLVGGRGQWGKPGRRGRRYLERSAAAAVLRDHPPSSSQIQWNKWAMTHTGQGRCWQGIFTYSYVWISLYLSLHLSLKSTHSTASYACILQLHTFCFIQALPSILYIHLDLILSFIFTKC